MIRFFIWLIFLPSSGTRIVVRGRRTLLGKSNLLLLTVLPSGGTQIVLRSCGDYWAGRTHTPQFTYLLQLPSVGIEPTCPA